MKPEDAIKILGLQEGATPDERADAFKSQRTKLEQKLVQAPTPGLQNKYREALRRLEEAYETLELLNGNSDLPALRPDFDVGVEKLSTPSRTNAERNATGSKSIFAKSEPKNISEPLVSETPAKSDGLNVNWLAILAVILVIVAGWYFGMKKPAKAANAKKAAEELVQQQVATQKAVLDNKAQADATAAQLAEEKRNDDKSAAQTIIDEKAKSAPSGC